MTTYELKDSGNHENYESGMRRSSEQGKPRFDLIRTKRQPYQEQMIYRYAIRLAKGADVYDARNWEEGSGQEELDRAISSLLRHVEQLVAGETDEDHAAAVWFNTQQIEYLRWRMETPDSDGLTGAERLAKACRESEINQLALQKAMEIRRRVRLRESAAEFDQELQEAAQKLKDDVDKEQSELDRKVTHGDREIIDVNDNGSPVYATDLTRNHDSGAIGLFQFVNGPWPTPEFTAHQESLGAQIAENIRKASEGFSRSIVKRYGSPKAANEAFTKDYPDAN